MSFSTIKQMIPKRKKIKHIISGAEYSKSFELMDNHSHIMLITCQYRYMMRMLNKHVKKRYRAYMFFLLTSGRFIPMIGPHESIDELRATSLRTLLVKTKSSHVLMQRYNTKFDSLSNFSVEISIKKHGVIGKLYFINLVTTNINGYSNVTY